MKKSESVPAPEGETPAKTIKEESERLSEATLDFTNTKLMEAQFLRVTALIFANENASDTEFIINTVNRGADDRFAALIPFAPDLKILIKQLPARISILTEAFNRGQFTKTITDDTITKLRKTVIDAVKPVVEAANL